MNTITVFTDGASRGNPGPGGWACIISDGEKVVERGGREVSTTNNRMEIQAAVEALNYIYKQKMEPERVVMHTDSAYLVNGVTKWLVGWQENNWQTKTKEAVKNEDLWRELASAVDHFSIDWVRVSGHADVPGNMRADEIATEYADGNTPKLFSGAASTYGKDLSIVKASAMAIKKKKSRQGEAYSYVSLVDGKVETHKTWAECEARVKGVSGARFKKSLSKDDEAQIIHEFIK